MTSNNHKREDVGNHLIVLYNWTKTTKIKNIQILIINLHYCSQFTGKTQPTSRLQHKSFQLQQQFQMTSLHCGFYLVKSSLLLVNFQLHYPMNDIYSNKQQFIIQEGKILNSWTELSTLVRTLSLECGMPWHTLDCLAAVSWHR